VREPAAVRPRVAPHDLHAAPTHVDRSSPRPAAGWRAQIPDRERVANGSLVSAKSWLPARRSSSGAGPADLAAAACNERETPDRRRPARGRPARGHQSNRPANGVLAARGEPDGEGRKGGRSGPRPGRAATPPAAFELLEADPTGLEVPPRRAPVATAAPVPIEILVNIARHCRLELVSDPARTGLRRPRGAGAGSERSRGYLASLPTAPVDSRAPTRRQTPSRGALRKKAGHDPCTRPADRGRARRACPFIRPRFLPLGDGGATPPLWAPTGWPRSSTRTPAAGTQARSPRGSSTSLSAAERALELPPDWDGVLVTGGQMANFTGLAARGSGGASAKASTCPSTAWRGYRRRRC